MSRLGVFIMMYYKKSFALLLTLLFFITFSFLWIYILEVKTYQSNISTKQYQKIQADLYLEFAKNYISKLELDNEQCINSIKIDNENFDIYANFFYISEKNSCSNYVQVSLQDEASKGTVRVDLYVRSKSSIFKVKLHERFLKKL